MHTEEVADGALCTDRLAAEGDAPQGMVTLNAQHFLQVRAVLKSQLLPWVTA
jgi:hypothetical protein